MSKEEIEVLGYHCVECPHCKKEIYIPEYRQQPVIRDRLKLFAKEVMERREREKE